MKALVISDDDKSLGVIDSILQTNGIDSINYKWLIKALDNVEEIRPDLIIINVLDYPRHWKTLAQFVRSTFEDSIKILLYVPESFSSDEYKKAAELGIESCFSSFDDFAKEREIFSSSFDFIEDKARVSPIWEKPVDTYYVYQKK